MRFGLPASVTRLARLTVEPNQSPPRGVAGPNATPTRNGGNSSPSASVAATSACSVSSIGSTSHATSITASPIVLTSWVGRWIEAVASSASRVATWPSRSVGTRSPSLV